MTVLTCPPDFAHQPPTYLFLTYSVLATVRLNRLQGACNGQASVDCRAVYMYLSDGRAGLDSKTTSEVGHYAV
jgi:hypothetical protein